MPRITLKEVITKKIDIPLDALLDLVDHLTEAEKERLLARLQSKPFKCQIFEKDKIESIISDFEAVDLYEQDFLKDLEEGLKKSSLYR